VGKTIKEIGDAEATGDDDVPVDVLVLLGEDGHKLMTQLISNMYETGERPRDFIEFLMVALKKQKATKCSDYYIDSKDSSEDIWKKDEMKMKIEDALGED
jgi:hypothetical protein